MRIPVLTFTTAIFPFAFVLPVKAAAPKNKEIIEKLRSSLSDASEGEY